MGRATVTVRAYNWALVKVALEDFESAGTTQSEGMQ
jgi:hypothetical protein